MLWFTLSNHLSKNHKSPFTPARELLQGNRKSRIPIIKNHLKSSIPHPSSQSYKRDDVKKKAPSTRTSLFHTQHRFTSVLCGAINVLRAAIKDEASLGEIDRRIAKTAEGGQEHRC